MNREEMLRQATQRNTLWDFVVVGGGATGAGIALDAATRGYSVVLLERSDFGAGTSSRSTKLVHGGVRYLRQARFGLVMEALQERSRLLQNAPHIVHDLAFVLPCYRRLDVAFYGLGLKTYDLLAGRHRFGHSAIVSKKDVQALLPTIQGNSLRGGVVYHDGQFDDARLLIHLLMTAVYRGAVVLNYASVESLSRASDGTINGVIARDVESGMEVPVQARVVVNAAGPFCDDVRRMANPVSPALIAASQGSHIVLDRSFLPGNAALLIPNTPDGRVLFAIPWHGHTLVGTTDVAVPSVPVEPRSSPEEIDFILETAGRYLSKQPQRADVLSTFAGIRPLVKAGGGHTASLARDHTIRVEEPGLLTITGGKWTTYRNMAEACVDKAAVLAKLSHRACSTKELRIHGYSLDADRLGSLSVYGSDAAEIKKLVGVNPLLAAQMHPALPYIEAEVLWAVRAEMARNVADVLARRLRALFLNAKAAIEMAPRVAELVAVELGKGADWVGSQIRAFTQLALGYRVL
ncbi:MAG TPA: glycerol-3-phosphate dehydrogenase/oxidase [Gemmata sp.]|jgi:glycerol-3-phosphate dehydrogenase|nr:glycerol-3-phosphate dehydrogenase/oxidase [Gemmata sp.]